MKDNVNVKLSRLADKDLNQILDMINSDEELKNTFAGGRNTIQRVLDSVYAALIKAGNKTVGFVMITENPRTYKYEIDMGVLKSYRNNGYATKALDLLKGIILHNKLNIEVQTKKTNKAAIESIKRNGFTLYRQDKLYNYYTLKEDSKQIR